MNEGYLSSLINHRKGNPGRLIKKRIADFLDIEPHYLDRPPPDRRLLATAAEIDPKRLLGWPSTGNNHAAESGLFSMFSVFPASGAAAQAIDTRNPLVACYLGAISGDWNRSMRRSGFIPGWVRIRPVRRAGASSNRCGHLPAPSEYDRQRQADIALRRVRERMSPIIQGWIAGAQAGSPDCPRR